MTIFFKWGISLSQMVSMPKSTLLRKTWNIALDIADHMMALDKVLLIIVQPSIIYIVVITFGKHISLISTILYTIEHLCGAMDNWNWLLWNHVHHHVTNTRCIGVIANKQNVSTMNSRFHTGTQNNDDRRVGIGQDTQSLPKK